MNDANIERQLFYMDEKGSIVNYLLNPPNMTTSKENFIHLMFNLSKNKVELAQIKRMALMKQLNMKNQTNLTNKNPENNIKLP